MKQRNSSLDNKEELKLANQKILTNNIVKQQLYENADDYVSKLNGLEFIKHDIGKNMTSVKNLNFDVFINNMIQDEVQASESKVDLN